MHDIDTLRAKAAAYCERATNGATGRTVDDPIYQEAVERRDPGPKYSSCADLAHGMLAELGCIEHWVNRAALKGVNGHPGFRYGTPQITGLRAPLGKESANPFAELVAPTVSARRAALKSLAPGDIMVTWTTGNDAHVCVFCSFDGARVTSWDLGQGPLDPKAWVNNRSHIEADRRVRSVAYFPLRSVLRLERVPLRGAVDSVPPLEPPDLWTRDLRNGHSGNDVRYLQERLNTFGVHAFGDDWTALKVDGAFGPKTEGGVRALQAWEGLPVNGVADLALLRLLDDSLAILDLIPRVAIP